MYMRCKVTALALVGTVVGVHGSVALYSALLSVSTSWCCDTNSVAVADLMVPSAAVCSCVRAFPHAERRAEHSYELQSQ
jgi:hypothetical protein